MTPKSNYTLKRLSKNNWVVLDSNKKVVGNMKDPIQFKKVIRKIESEK